MKIDLRVARDFNTYSSVLVYADDAATIAEIAAPLAQALGYNDASELWLDGACLDSDCPVADSALRQGSSVAFESGFQVSGSLPQIGWQLHVVGGPAAGTIANLPIGSHTLGRESSPPIPDGSMSRSQARLDVSAEGTTIVDLHSTNGTSVDGQAVPREGEGPPMVVVPGQTISMGDSLVTIVPAAKADAPTHVGPDGTIQLTRPPRLRPPAEAQRIAMPVEPQSKSNRKIPLAGILAPLGLGAVMFLVAHNALFLLFGLASPMMAVGNYISDRRGNSKDHRAAMQRYNEQMAATSERLEKVLIDETARRRFHYPDPSAAYLIATLPGSRLWERRRRDPDALSLRLGVADLNSDAELRSPTFGNDAGQSPNGPRTVYNVPAVVELKMCGVLGLSGPADVVDGLARWLVIQLGVLHPPRDLSLTLLTSSDRTMWSWFRWLPQSATLNPDTAIASIGNDAETLAARIEELGELLKVRQEASSGFRMDGSLFSPHVVLLDGARELRSIPGLTRILQDGPAVGIYSICLADEERFLPEECGAVVSIDVGSSSYFKLRQHGKEDVTNILGDQISQPFCETVATALSPIRDDAKEDGEIPLPDSARLLDILGMEPPTVDGVRAHWMLEGRSTRAAIGIGSGGTFWIDLRTDGPHGLIAGTTGAGKSELLQTLVASLAVGNRPNQLNFVLIDYKGGSAFKDCVKLPHTVGMVTDLDAHLVERALSSLGAEIKRREHMLAAIGAKDIEDYNEIADGDASVDSIPRLVLVIDEFASMVRDLPEFVAGLVSIAQRGRSLGVHLILATQRPTGVVSPEIRANTNLRISLRVTDVADSQDVINVSDAARIPKSIPGRAFARMGHNALMQFQAGRIGGRRPGAVPESKVPPTIVELGWGQLGYPPPPPVSDGNREIAVETDLGDLVSVIVQAAEFEGLDRQRRPWLEALPHKLLLSELGSSESEGKIVPIPFGLEDLPERQLQVPATFDLSGGHMLVVGSSRSGRSQCLRTIAGSAAQLISPNDLHIYGLDCGNGALLALSALPHCGAIVGRTESERALRLLARLKADLASRQALLASSGYADIHEQRRSVSESERLPHIVVFVDRWEGFTSSLADLDGGVPLESMLTILREGASAGVHAVIAGDRTLASGKAGSLCDNKLALRMADRNDFSFVGLNPRKLPDEIRPGRAFSSERGTEIQIALLAADESGQAQSALLSEIAQKVQLEYRVSESRRPFRVDELPSRISFEEAMAYQPVGDPKLFALVGIGGDERAARGPDLATNSVFIVTGPSRSGRSTTLLNMTRSLLSQGAEVVIAAPRASALRNLDGHPGVRAVVLDSGAGIDVWQEHLGIRECPLIVVIDDGEELKDSPAGDLFRRIIQGSGEIASALILGGAPGGICMGISGWQVEAKKARQGLVLSPQTQTDGDVVSARIPRSAIGGPLQPGRGLLHLGDGTLTPLALPI